MESWSQGMMASTLAGERVSVYRHRYISTFRVSRRPREMYCGHARLCVCLCVCVCLSVCLSVCPRPHAHTIARTRM